MPKTTFENYFTVSFLTSNGCPNNQLKNFRCSQAHVY